MPPTLAAKATPSTRQEANGLFFGSVRKIGYFKNELLEAKKNKELELQHY